ncbi:hypothetical protein, partial [Xanthomonas citri]
ILNSSVYRLLLMDTSESAIFHGLEMSRKSWAYHKAEFSMTLLESSKLDQVDLPDYIHRGLLWLIAQLKRKEDEVAGKLPIIPLTTVDTAAAEAEVTP